MTDRQRPDPPSAFIEEWIATLGPHSGARALDVAAGRGRHARLIARVGYRTFIVDRDLGVLLATTTRLRDDGLAVIPWCADLEQSPLPTAFFDLIVVTRYLQRDLFAALAAVLAPGGVLLYETFTEHQRHRGRGPTSPAHLLNMGELAHAFPSLETVFYEEVEEPDAVARLVARASTSRS